MLWIILLSAIAVSLLGFVGVHGLGWLLAASAVCGCLYERWKYGAISEAISTMEAPGGAEKAVELCDKIVAKRSKDWRGYVVRCYALEFANRRPEALSDINFALTLDPGNVHARIAKAGLLLDMSDWDEARLLIDQLSTELDNRMDFFWSRDSWLSCLYLSGVLTNHDRDFDRTLAIGRKILNFAPTWSQARIGLANYWREQGNYEEALKELESIKNRRGRVKAFYHSNRARVFIGQNCLTEALEEARLAVREYPTSAPLMGTYGKSLYLNGSLAEAEDALDQAISLNPTRGETYWFRHELRRLQGDEEGAAIDEKTARSFGYEPPPADLCSSH